MSTRRPTAWHLLATLYVLRGLAFGVVAVVVLAARWRRS